MKTKWENQKFVPVAWDGHDVAHGRMSGLRMGMGTPSSLLRRVGMRFMRRC